LRAKLPVDSLKYFTDGAAILGNATPYCLRTFKPRLWFAPSVLAIRRRAEDVLYAIILHLLAGGVTGSIFKIRTLLLVLGFVLSEFAILALVEGGIAFLWAVAALIAVQVGFVVGIYARALLEHAGYAAPRVDRRRVF
jgi:hypothetical protein